MTRAAPADTPSPGHMARVFVVLAWLAVLGHLALTTHHASVVHELCADGHLHHACASHGDPAEPLPSEDSDPEDDEGEPCPLQKPCVDTGLDAKPTHANWTPLGLRAEPALADTSSVRPLDVLDVAPKQSPPLPIQRS